MQLSSSINHLEIPITSKVSTRHHKEISDRLPSRWFQPHPRCSRTSGKTAIGHLRISQSLEQHFSNLLLQCTVISKQTTRLSQQWGNLNLLKWTHLTQLWESQSLRSENLALKLETPMGRDPNNNNPTNRIFRVNHKWEIPIWMCLLNRDSSQASIVIILSNHYTSNLRVLSNSNSNNSSSSSSSSSRHTNHSRPRHIRPLKEEIQRQSNSLCHATN